MDLSLTNCPRAWATESLSGLTIKPALSATSDRMPQKGVTITGTPHAIASAATLAKFSYRDGRAKTLASARAEYFSLPNRGPVKITRDPTLDSRAHFLSLAQ